MPGRCNPALPFPNVKNDELLRSGPSFRDTHHVVETNRNNGAMMSINGNDEFFNCA